MINHAFILSPIFEFGSGKLQRANIKMSVRRCLWQPQIHSRAVFTNKRTRGKHFLNFLSHGSVPRIITHRLIYNTMSFDLSNDDNAGKRCKFRGFPQFIAIFRAKDAEM